MSAVHAVLTERRPQPQRVLNDLKGAAEQIDEARRDGDPDRRRTDFFRGLHALVVRPGPGPGEGDDDGGPASVAA